MVIRSVEPKIIARVIQAVASIFCYEVAKFTILLLFCGFKT